MQGFRGSRPSPYGHKRLTPGSASVSQPIDAASPQHAPISHARPPGGSPAAPVCVALAAASPAGCATAGAGGRRPRGAIRGPRAARATTGETDPWPSTSPTLPYQWRQGQPGHDHPAVPHRSPRPAHCRRYAPRRSRMARDGPAYRGDATGRRPADPGPVSSGKSLLDRVEERGKFPGIRHRYCTGVFKRTPIERDLRRYPPAR